MSHPAGAHFGVPHGVANAIHLPHVIRFNAEGGSDIADRYRDVDELLGVESGGSDEDVGDALAEHVTELVERLGLPTAAVAGRACPRTRIPALVEGAMGDGTTLLNPREPSEDDYAELYKRALCKRYTSGILRRLALHPRAGAASRPRGRRRKGPELAGEHEGKLAVGAVPRVAGHPQPDRVAALWASDSVHPCTRVLPDSARSTRSATGSLR